MQVGLAFPALERRLSRARQPPASAGGLQQPLLQDGKVLPFGRRQAATHCESLEAGLSSSSSSSSSFVALPGARASRGCCPGPHSLQVEDVCCRALAHA